MPVPLPVTAGAAWPVKAAMRAADGVVLPIPMSPVTRHRAPFSTRSAAMSAPTPSAVVVSSGVIAGSSARFAVPGRTFARTSPSAASSSLATPTSTTTTPAPAWRASTLMAAPPAQKLATI